MDLCNHFPHLALSPPPVCNLCACVLSGGSSVQWNACYLNFVAPKLEIMLCLWT